MQLDVLPLMSERLGDVVPAEVWVVFYLVEDMVWKSLARLISE